MLVMEYLLHVSINGDAGGSFMAFSTMLLLTVAALAVSSYAVYIYYWRPSCMRKDLVQKGFVVLPYRPIAGDVPQLKHLEAQAQLRDISHPSHHHLLVPYIYPFYNMLRSQYPRSRVVFWWGNLPQIVISNASDARRILSADVNYMQKVELSTRAFHKLVGRRGLLLANGKEWHLQRNILRPAFFVEKLKGLVADIATSSSNMIQVWKMRADNNEHMAAEVEIEVARDLKNVTADILARTMFGSSYLKGKSVFERLEILLEMTMKLHLRMTANPFYEYLPTDLNRKIWSLDRRNNQELREIIEERTRSVVGANDKELRSDHGTDLLGLVLDATVAEAKLGAKGAHLSTQQVIDDCKTFFFAGHETTANLLAWSLVLLSLNQEWQEKGRQEVWEVCGKQGAPNSDDLNKLKIVGMILNESLRLYPPVPQHSQRELLDSVRIDEETVLPRGTGVVIPCLCIHRDKEVWGEDADEFSPDRFAKGISQACKNSFAFMPFGVGSRICIGQHFALMEAKVILAHILQNFEFRLSPSYRHAPVVSITMRPKHGVQLLLRSVSKN